ncbi:MAG: type II toxin-antitoxin system RelE/ParE family toxin [Betaproteobacteria bacterium]
MVFVELTPFVRFREQHWTDDELRALQRFLLVTPAAGEVIRGTHGLRKLRWAASGRGKRGGARVIYYLQASADRIYLVYGYVKAEQENLTPQQLKLLAALMKEVDDG